MKSLQNKFSLVFLMLICIQLFSQNNEFDVVSLVDESIFYSQNKNHNLIKNEPIDERNWDDISNLNNKKRKVSKIISTKGAIICNIGFATISATSNGGVISWYDSQVGGNLLFSGDNFTTPILDTSTTYFAEASIDGYSNSERMPGTYKSIKATNNNSDNT